MPERFKLEVKMININLARPKFTADQGRLNRRED